MGFRKVLDQGFLHAGAGCATRGRPAARGDGRPVALRARGPAWMQSAYPRFLRSTNPSTMVVDVGGLNAEGYDALDAIAHLRRWRRLTRTSPSTSRRGSMVTDFSPNFEALGSIDGRYFDQDRFTPIRVGCLTRLAPTRWRSTRRAAALRLPRRPADRLRHVGATDVEGAQTARRGERTAPPPADPRDDRRCRCLHRGGRPGRHRSIAARAVHSGLRQSGEGPGDLRVAGPRAPQRRRRRRRGQTDHHRTLGQRAHSSSA